MPCPTPLVKAVASEDLESTAPLWAELIEESVGRTKLAPLPTLLSQVRARMAASALSVAQGGTATYRLSVAFDDSGTALGLASMRVLDAGPLMAASAVIVDVVHVARAHRRSGVGRALLGDAVSFAGTCGVEDVTVHVPTGARELNRFYASWGFTARTTRRGTSVMALRRRVGLDLLTVAPQGSNDLPQLARLLRRRALLGARMPRTGRNR